MRNLKRTLSVVLAAIMLIGLMVTSASATSVYDSFPDKDEIVNKDAVNLLTILEIINGQSDGTFNPTGNVTRAEMAKMISVVMNKGRDNGDAYKNLFSTGLSDVDSHWAAGHINFCYNEGIIVGRGDGTFDPEASVTAPEAAKMLLVAAGYDPAIEGYEGNAWAINVNSAAAAKGIYDNYTGGVGTTSVLSRDDAALLIYNALDVEMIASYNNGYAQVYGDYRTILSEMYGVYKIKGVVIGNEWAELNKSEIDDALSAGRTRVADIDTYESNTQSTVTLPSDMRALLGTTQIFNTSTPVEYLGKTVTMYIRKTTVLNDYEVLGVYLRDVDNNIITKAADTDMTDALKNTGLKSNSDTEYYVNYGIQPSDTASRTALGWKNNNGNGIDMEIIDNNLDGIVDYVLYLKRDLTVVSVNRNNTVLYGFNNGKNIENIWGEAIGNGIWTAEELTKVEVADEDVVLAVTYGGRYYVREPEVVTGQMTAYDNSKTKEETIDVEGVTYKASAIGVLGADNTSANGRNEIVDFFINLCNKDNGVQFTTNYEFFLDTHGNIRAFRPTDETTPQYALILESGYDPSVYASEASGKVTVLMADATRGTYSLDFSASAANLATQLGYTGNDTVNGVTFTKSDRGIIELKAFLGTDYTDNSATRPWRFAEYGSAAPNALVASRTYTFAYRGTDVSETNQARATYPAGKAAGYVISYTLNTETNVMTIKNIIGGVGVNKVNYGPWNNYRYTDTQLEGTNEIHTLHTNGDTLSANYAGESTVWNGETRGVAVDRNTIAFYYEKDETTGEVKSAVVTGYQNMSSIDAGTQFVSGDVVTTSWNGTKYEYKNTNLAEVILFNQCKVDTYRDYAYVLSANRITKDRATLNVIFENGEAGTLTMTYSHYQQNFSTDSAFNRVWAYRTDSNGLTTVDNGAAKYGVGGKLKVGTFDLHTPRVAGDKGYYSYNPATANIWDVTNQKAGEDAYKLSDFYFDNWNVILILDTNGVIKTAFVTEYTAPAGTTATGHTAKDHTWDWRLASNLDPDYQLLPTSANADSLNTSLRRNDVRIVGNVTLTGNVYIPAGTTLYIEGDLSTNGRIYGEGNLYVEGNLTTSGSVLEVQRIFVAGKWIVSANITLGNGSADVDMYVNEVDASAANANLTIAKSADLHVGFVGITSKDSANEGKVNMGSGTLTIDGHMESDGATGTVTTTGGVTVTSAETLIVRGNFSADTLTIGATNSAGTMSVTGDFTITSTVTLANGGTKLTIADGTINIASGITGKAGAQVILGEDAVLDANDNSGLKWDANTEVDPSAPVENVTFTIPADNQAPVATEETASAIPAVTVSVAKKTDSAYVTVADADVTTITFGAESTDADVVVTVTTAPAGATVTVDGGSYDGGDLTIDKPAAGKTSTVTVNATFNGYQNVTKTITVKNLASE